MNIFYVYRTARKPLLQEYIAKKAPSTFLYGLPELKKLGIEAVFSDNAWQRWNILRSLLLPIEKLFQFLLHYPIGFQLHQALALWPKYRNSDIIITAQDSAGLPFLLLKSFGFIKPKIIYISGSLVNVFNANRNPLLLRFIKYLLQHADALVCYSNKEKDVLMKYVDRKVNYIPLGIDIDFFVPSRQKQLKSIDILAAGRDKYRDYQTLFQAVTNSKWRVTLACAPENIKGLVPPPNVEILLNADVHTMKKLYKQAKLVVVPMKPTDRTQGLVVLMEATAMGKPIIASRVSGITTAYDLKKFNNITLVEPRNSHSLKKRINQLLKENKENFLPIASLRASISTYTSAKQLIRLFKEVKYI